MPNKKCKICDQEFYIKPSHLKMGWGKYCSVKCRQQSQKKGKYVECAICKKKSWKQPRDLKRSKSQLFFCSKNCQTIWRNKYFQGKRHANWKNGEYAYRKILEANNINPACKMCKNKDQRVLEAHHIDRNRNNNDITNLVWLCCNCHCLVHRHGVKIK